MSRSLILCCIALLACASALETIRFSKPKSLVDQYPNGMDNRPALFGVPPYGVSISGRVLYATPGDHDGCEKLNMSVLESPPKPGETFIVMVDRGNCTFCTKVRNAQEVGARAVIIVDNRDETTLPYMADDGTGATITVPSLLVHKADGDAIKESYADGTVVATMKWGVPNPDGTVEWSFWTSSYDDNSVEFKSVFEIVSDALNDSAVFTPHYFFLDGTIYGCEQNSGTACGNQCINSGKYCEVDPDHNLEDGISGADVVTENLRQLCIWRKVNATQTPDKWWKYVNCFQTSCADKSDYSLSCSKTCQEKLGIPSNLIDECVSASGGAAVTGPENNLIKAEMKLQEDTGVFIQPTIIINNVPYRGSLNCPTPITVSNCGVLSAICSGYAKDTAPVVCTDNEGCPIGQVRDACGNCGGDGSVDACGNCLPQNHPDRRNDASKCGDVFNSTKTSVSAGTVVAIVFLMVTIVSLGFFYLHRRSQASMRRELADIMAQYVPLKNEDAEGLQAVPSALDSAGTGRKGSF